MKKSNITLNIFLLFLTMQIAMTFSKVYSQSQWEITTIPNETNNGYVVDVDFINANTGFIALKVNPVINKMIIYKTTDKGLNFREFWSTTYYDPEFGISFNNADTGFVFYGDDVYKIWGDYNQSRVIDNSWVPSKHRIKIFENGIGYCLYGTTPSTNGFCYAKIYKTNNFGNSWSVIYDTVFAGNQVILSDVDILKSNPDSVIAVGQIRGLDGFHPRSRSAIRITSSNGFDSTHYINSIANVNDRIAFDFVNFLPNGESRILANDGIYNQSLTKICSITEAGLFTTQYGFRFINNNLGLAALNSGNLIQTTNGGYNWSVVANIGYGILTSSQISSIGDIAYYGDATFRYLFTRKLNTDLKTYYDNQSISNSINFDGTNYSSPSTQYLRGGNSIVYSSLPNIIDPNQISEKLFYKWSNGNMNYTDSNYYFDMSGIEIANYYKSRSLSTTSNAINNSGQIKSWRDTAGAINRIYESIGGIFFSKSYDNGINFKREEVFNYSANVLDGNNNTNPSIFEARDNSWNNSNPVTHWDRNKNIVACWERFNSTSGETEIKLSARDYEINSDTTFKWNRWAEGSEDRFTHFTSPSYYRSFPKIFAVSMGFTNLGYLHDNYFLIVPHLRPASNGNKIEVSCRFNYIHADFQIDSGEISDLSVINYPNTYLSVPLHIVYRKGIKIIYYKAQFNADGTMAITKTQEEGPIEVSSGDGGFPSRFAPDISLMNNIPVITYAASYDAWRTIEYEDHTTGSIQVYRHPIIKVQRINSNKWSNFVIYNSGNIQSNPDIEGSKSSSSYILNYSIGNGTFKKIANVNGYPGSMCQPNIFSGTDSRLIKNSYTGSFGSNLSLLTLSPQSGLYKLDKQDFVITNITALDAYDIDNLDGVVNLDTISYSFKVGPIYTQSFYENYYEIDGVGVIGPSY